MNVTKMMNFTRGGGGVREREFSTVTSRDFRLSSTTVGGVLSKMISQYWTLDPSTSPLPPQFLALALNENEKEEEENIFLLTNDTFENCSYYTNCTNCTFSNCTVELREEVNSKNYFALLLLVFSVFAVFGNMLVILAVKRERSLWNVTNYFIVSLAVADLLVAGVVMPFGVYVLFNGTKWLLPLIFCDFYIAMDVTCSTSSILNLVAISIDRFIAVTQPIKYAKHKSNTRVWLTIVFVWVFSGLVGSPIVLGLNTPLNTEAIPDGTSCIFHNYYFTFFSSLCSFYIPCTILVYLYYRIFKVIRERAKKACGGGKAATVIENLAHTKRLAETTLGGGGPSTLPIPPSQPEEDERGTNTGSGSQEEEDMDRELDEGDDEAEENSPDSADECQVIPNNRLATAFVLESVRIEERGALGNGNHDSGYAASNLEEGPHPVAQEPSPASPKLSIPLLEPCKRNGLKDAESTPSVGVESAATSSKKAAASRFTICKAHKASRRKKEKSSAKRERKATKTLAIVLGLFLLCWLPFFTCNIMEAICKMLGKKDCDAPIVGFLITTWLGYANSCLNPIIYTIFNPEFRKAFKKIMGMGT